MNNYLALMTGIDIPIKKIQVNVHQPTIKEISYIGEENFFIAIRYLTLSKDKYSQLQEKQSLLKELSPFSFLMIVLQNKEMKEIKDNILQTLQILFPEYKIIFSPQSILLKLNDKIFTIDENNFEFFQDCLKEIFCLTNSRQEEFHPVDKKAREITEKILKGRKKVAQQKKGKEEKKESLDNILSILAIGTSETLSSLIDLTFYQVINLMKRYELFVSWDIQIKSRLAGSTSNEEIPDWMSVIK